MGAIFSKPEVWIALLGIAGSLLGWALKHWALNVEEKLKTEERQRKEEKAAQDFSRKQADDTAKSNADIKKSDDAEKAFRDQKD